MKQNEIIQRLKVWQERSKELDAQWEAFAAVTGAHIEGPLANAIYRLGGEYTKAVAELVGDQGEWLDYFQYECEFGAKPKWVHSSDGVQVMLKDVRALAKVLTWVDQ